MLLSALAAVGCSGGEVTQQAANKDFEDRFKKMEKNAARTGEKIELTR